MRIKEKLRSERLASEQRWREFIRSKDTRLSTNQASWLAQSWQMSAVNVSVNKTSAPLEDPDSVRAQFVDSHFYQAANPVLQDLQQALADTGFAIGLSDAQAQLQWTYTSRAMARKLESVHFLPSARWDEASIGTNAVGLKFIPPGRAQMMICRNVTSAGNNSSGNHNRPPITLGLWL